MNARLFWSVLGLSVWCLHTAPVQAQQSPNQGTEFRYPAPILRVAQPPVAQPAQPPVQPQQPPQGQQQPPIIPNFDDLGGPGQDPMIPSDLSTQMASNDLSAPTGNLGFENPPLLGDLLGPFVTRSTILNLPVTVLVDIADSNTGNIISLTPVTVTEPTTVLVNVPHAFRGPFKITENESPRPQNRVYFTYRYFNNLGSMQQTPVPGALASAVANDQISFDFLLARLNNPNIIDFDPDSVTVGTANLSQSHVHQETLGLERTILDGRASLGVRIPLIQQTGEPSFEDSDLGDITFIFKGIVTENPETGSLLSAGLAVTAPTGPGLMPITGEEIHPTLIQPFLGFVLNMDTIFVQGFSSAIFPTDDRDVVLLNNDVAIGARFFRGNPDALIKFITPTVELHVTTPLEESNARDVPIGFPDVFTLTGAVHVGVGERAVVSVGVATPLSGPNPNDVEGILSATLFY